MPAVGNNGYIWIGPPLPDIVDGEVTEQPGPVSLDLRQRIARVRNVIVALANQFLPIFDTSIIYSYEDSEAHDIKDLVNPDVSEEITLRARSIGLNDASAVL